jgi:uncharacterized surface protein with fasciclin (FAS1) repeats
MALISLLAFSCKKSKDEQKTVYQTIAADQHYSFLTAAINKAGLVNALNDNSKEGLTLFAPSNDAFMAAGFTSVADLAKVPDSVLTKILLYHVLGTRVLAAQIPQASNSEVKTLNTQPIYATRTSDNKVFINGVAVVKADIVCTNGVIHEINRVLLPATGTIVQTAINNPDLSLLVAAVLRASQGSTDVSSVLSGAGPFTVFAPTNQAFINAGFADANAINAADPNTLTSILTYHVIAGRIFSSDLTDGATPATVNGATVTISLSAGTQVKGNGNSTTSNITATDIVASNGVVHIIDQVLLP